MARFGLKSAFPLAFVLGSAIAVSAVTIAQAQAPRDTQDPNISRLNDPANARGLNDQQDPNTSRLNDPANARGHNDKDGQPDANKDEDKNKDNKAGLK